MSTTETRIEASPVGGVVHPRPFKIRRLGHFGINVKNYEACKAFYLDTLGFMFTEELDFAGKVPDGGFFARYGTDHHAFVVAKDPVWRKILGNFDRVVPEDMTINQITWQVGSLHEVAKGDEYLRDLMGLLGFRRGREMPGSNWHTYMFDDEHFITELYYGIEQVGWDGRAKPKSLFPTRGFMEPAPMPQISEGTELVEAEAQGIDLLAGSQWKETAACTFDVEGILLARPFKITKVGPIKLFVDDYEAAKHLYVDGLGFRLTEEVSILGKPSLFLRANTEHHSLVIMPKSLRSELGLRPESSLAAFGVRIGSYSQLRNAHAFLRDQGVKIRTDLPAEFTPGSGPTFHAEDPDGQLIQFYVSMEQIGWDGRPRPAADRPTYPADPAEWPETIEADDSFWDGEVFLGPLG